MINKNKPKKLLIDYISNEYIDKRTDEIKKSIFSSKFANTYMKYRYNYKSKLEGNYSSLINDDWHFCIFICKFVNSKESLSNIVLILERFLYNHRYHQKFDNDSSYLKLTINKVITVCIKDSLIGSLRADNEVYDVLYEKSKSNIKSIDKRAIIKVCNIFSPFFLDKTNSKELNNSLIYQNYTNSENTVKVEMLGGTLNSFDLCVFLCVLKEYKKYYDEFTYDDVLCMNLLKDEFHVFEMKMSSLIALFQSRNSGSISKRIIASLNKLSKTHIEVYKNHKQSISEKNIVSNSIDYLYYSFSGNLLSFKTIQTKRFINLTIYLSMPLVKVFQSHKYYALINWQSFTSLPNYHLRLLYFYFCLNVKVSRYFSEFGINDLVSKLFKSSPNNNAHFRKRKQLLRKLCQFFCDNQDLFDDFDFKLSSNSSMSTFTSIKVRRSKLYLT